MAATYNCGDCNGTGRSAWTPYDVTPCKKCGGLGFIRASGVRPRINGNPAEQVAWTATHGLSGAAYDKQSPPNDSGDTNDEG